MENSYQNSTTAQIIDAIINQLSFEGESKSDIADILLSILNQTPYEKEPSSVIAELFIKLKAKIEGESFEPFDKPYISNIAEIIKSILDETEYNNAPNSRIAELLLELKNQLEGYKTVKFKDLNFKRSNNNGTWENFLFYVAIADKERGQPIQCSDYEVVGNPVNYKLENGTITAPTWSDYIYIRDDAYSTVDEFKTAKGDASITYKVKETD